MRDLKCGKIDCKYNKGYSCCSKQIAVDNHTDCVTYSMDETKKRSLFEAGNEFVQARFDVDTKVSCSAPCIFNKDSKCTANGITVMGENRRDAVCLTFVKN